MATYLIHRCHYNNPSEKRVVKFDNDETVLAWFVNRWGHDGDPYDWLEKEFGFAVYGLASIFTAASESELPSPENEAMLGAYIEEHLYTENFKDYQPGILRVSTDDDELEQAYFIIDDNYLAKAPEGDFDFLFHEDWKLPIEFGKGGFLPNSRVEIAKLFQGKGKVYFALSECVDSLNLDPITPTVFPGVQLDGFPQAMFSQPVDENWPTQVRLIRALTFQGLDELPDAEKNLVTVIRENPSDPDPWNVYSDWLMENRRPPMHVTFLTRAFDALKKFSPTDLPSSFGLGDWPAVEAEACQFLDETPDEKSQIAVSEHMAQACLLYDSWDYPSGKEKDIYHQ